MAHRWWRTTAGLEHSITTPSTAPDQRQLCNDSSYNVFLHWIDGVPLVGFQELQDGEHDVVDVAEAARLRLLGVVHAACSGQLASC